MKIRLASFCCSISLFLLTGCAALNLWFPARSGPPSTETAPPPPAPTPQADEINFEWVYFDYGEAALTPKTIAVLDETVKVLKENPTVSIELAGYTDAKGSDAYNLKLSQERVMSVHRYLTSEGIEAHRLRIAAFGKEKPVGDNQSEQGRAQNRRVEIRLVGD
jgi:OOP family OmpA-OmpF porin